MALFGLQYDAGGVAGAIWWTSAAVSVPVALLSEALGLIGIPASGIAGYVILTLALGATLYFVAGFARRRKSDR